MSDPDKLTTAPPVPAYGEDDEAKSMAKPSTPHPAAPASAAPASKASAPAAPALGEPPLASGTTETDVEKNRAEAAARAAAKGA